MDERDRFSLTRMSPLRVLAVLTGAAVLFGIFARLKGLSAWPLAVDEYYIARSVENLLRVGVPAYECGGYYTRGLAFQYIVALFRLLGASPEFSARFVAVLASLAVLPAAYLLGKRLHGVAAGLIAVAVLAVSVWEVEIARFGRMYTPFQAVFAWYLVFFLRYTVDREARALLAMIALTVLGALTWEGGAFLALANFLPVFLKNPSGRLSAADIRYLAGMSALAVPLVWFVTTDLRFTGLGTELPANFDPDAVSGGPRDAFASIPIWSTISAHPLWMAGALVPLACAAPAVRWIWSLRERWLTAAGLAIALAFALLHQFAAFAVALVLMMLLRLLGWRELTSRAALPYFAAAAAAAIFWVSYALTTQEWLSEAGSVGAAERLLLLAYEFVRFPDIAQVVLRPWLGAVPILTIALGVAVTIAVVRAIADETSPLTAERALLVVLVALVAAAGIADPPRLETRYVFFLYPLALILAIAVVMRAAESLRLRRQEHAAVLGALAAFALFAATEDFNPRHLARIDSPDVNFRVGLEGWETAHLLPRADVRGAAEWLKRNAEERFMVINGYPSVDQYYDGFDFTYIDASTPRFVAYACHRGTFERWGNLPLLSSESAIESRVALGDDVLLVLGRHDAQEMLRKLAPWQPEIAWTSREQSLAIIHIDGSNAKQARGEMAAGRTL